MPGKPTSFQLQSFEYVPGGPGIGLLRLAGHWPGTGDPVPTVKLLARTGDRTVRLRALPSPDASSRDQWRAAFSYSGDPEALGSVRFRLKAADGSAFELPAPVQRQESFPEQSPAPKPEGAAAKLQRRLEDERVRRADAEREWAARLLAEQARRAELDQRLDELQQAELQSGERLAQLEAELENERSAAERRSGEVEAELGREREARLKAERAAEQTAVLLTTTDEQLQAAQENLEAAQLELTAMRERAEALAREQLESVRAEHEREREAWAASTQELRTELSAARAAQAGLERKRARLARSKQEDEERLAEMEHALLAALAEGEGLSRRLASMEEQLSQARRAAEQASAEADREHALRVALEDGASTQTMDSSQRAELERQHAEEIWRIRADASRQVAEARKALKPRVRRRILSTEGALAEAQSTAERELERQAALQAELAARLSEEEEARDRLERELAAVEEEGGQTAQRLREAETYLAAAEAETEELRNALEDSTERREAAEAELAAARSEAQSPLEQLAVVEPGEDSVAMSESERAELERQHSEDVWRIRSEASAQVADARKALKERLDQELIALREKGEESAQRLAEAEEHLSAVTAENERLRRALEQSDQPSEWIEAESASARGTDTAAGEPTVIGLEQGPARDLAPDERARLRSEVVEQRRRAELMERRIAEIRDELRDRIQSGAQPDGTADIPDSTIERIRAQSQRGSADVAGVHFRIQRIRETLLELATEVDKR